MCLITLVPANITIPEDGIELGAESNPDGHGWVVASAEHGLVMGKSMKAEDAIAKFLAERERQGENSVAMFHSRLGTHGTKNVANVHPFYVPDPSGEGHDFKTVMAHNGVMPSLWHPRKDDDRSDTRVFGDRTAPWYLTERGVPSRRGGALIGQMIGGGNKLVFVSTRLEGRPLVRIINAKSGTWEKGVWFSNDWWKRKRYTTPSGYSGATGRVCAEKKCNTSFYTDDETHCFRHRKQVKCAEKDCKAEFAETAADKDQKFCTRHRPKVYCEETGCKSEVFTLNEKKCYHHRSFKAPKATPVTTGSVPVKEEGVRPPSSTGTRPPSWNGYGIYPGGGEPGESSTQDVLEDIEAMLEEQVQRSDISTTLVCEVCRTKGQVHIQTNICLRCKWCLDCYVPYTECDCFDFKKWIKEREGEANELAEALAREAIIDAAADEASEADRVAAEKAEEQWLGQNEEEQIEALMEFYGIKRDDALSILHDAMERRVVRTTKEEPKKHKQGARAKPASTKPTARSGRR